MHSAERSIKDLPIGKRVNSGIILRRFRQVGRQQSGGTGGVNYQRKMLDVVLFPEIWPRCMAL